ncbi:hypothetical protein AX16_009928 [Volvariella volvacea WC 439]|nr:hypothetical protein AX16_009928 [Volvariella volvacea WC 439]
MAVLAPPDWQQYPPRDSTMDISTTNPRQRSSPANDHPSSSAPAPSSSQQHHQHQHQQHHNHQAQQLPQQSFGYPLQQQPQGAWTPSITAQPFYPAFYQNHQQPQSQQPYSQIPPQAPFYDHANAQLWAYQQMLFNQVQQGFAHLPQHLSQQRNASGPSNDFYSQNQLNPAFNPFPSGTPPPHHRGGPGDHQQSQGQQQNPQYPAFHPYRRPSRQPSSHASEASDWRPMPHPPYARPDASGSSSSINSSSSQRQRTNSNQSGHSGHNTPSSTGSSRSRNVPSAAVSGSTRNSPSPASSSNSPTPSPLRTPHHRNGSSSSSSSTATSSRPSPLSPSLSTTTVSSNSNTAASSSGSSTPRPTRPSPLSQGTFTASEKRMSRDDSDLAALRDPIPTASMMRGGGGGLKSRLRRALSFNAAQALREEEQEDDTSIKASAQASSSGKSSLKPKSLNIGAATTTGPGGGVRSPESGVLDDGASAATVQTNKKRGRAASLFNSRLNASTDNISLSSTVSSASVMIRKLGSMGKLVRRNSLAGITSLFKDKDKEGKKKDKKGSAKAEVSEASVSHVTAELDRGGSGDWSMEGLSPAAKLARQHTLKTNAEAAAKAKAQQEAQAAIANAANTAKVDVQANASGSSALSSINGNESAGVAIWDRNTATKQGPSKGEVGGIKVNEDGTQANTENNDDDDDSSDEGHYGGSQQAGQSFHAEGWEDDEDWGEDHDGDEEVTIRAGLQRTSLDDNNAFYQEEPEPWAVDIRRSIEKTRKPMKGILKLNGKYNQEAYLSDSSSYPTARLRSNSYNSHGTSELGPLARMPSPDPDHIDGLHRHNSHSSGHGPKDAVPLIPPLPFESGSSSRLSMSLEGLKGEPSTPPSTSTAAPEKASIFIHPNSSAPALSTISTTSTPPTLTHRSATAPSKRLAFASNLSVYDTFSSTVYDRRSEPATWSRLTPALAQRIKEELNSYKMEEMEVHAASRIHTQFFV